MTHFAEVINGIVIRVIVAEQEFINNLENKLQWLQTSYNTTGGINSRTDIPIRKNYASIGCIYDKDRDAFMLKKPHNSWILNEDTCLWDSPIPHPDSTKTHVWNESNQEWDKIND
jgi:hypothetical protein